MCGWQRWRSCWAADPGQRNSKIKSLGGNAIPHIVFGFYGMNVVGFGGVTMFVPIAVTLILMALSAVILAKLGMFK